jgi:hypothetical protein
MKKSMDQLKNMQFQKLQGILIMNQLTKSKIEKLRNLNHQANNGYRISCISTILLFLDSSKFEEAQAVWENDGDKIQSYPEIKAAIIDIFGCRLHLKQNCSSNLCQNLNESCMRNPRLKKFLDSIPFHLRARQDANKNSTPKTFTACLVSSAKAEEIFERNKSRTDREIPCSRVFINYYIDRETGEMISLI